MQSFEALETNTVVTIDYLPAEDSLILRSIPKRLRKQPLLLGFIRQVNGEMTSSGEVSLPTTPQELSSRYKTINRLLERLGVGTAPSQDVDGALQRVQAEDESFKEFSRRAAEIWDGELNTEEFRSFTQVVKGTCSGRTFYRKQLLSAYHMAFSQNTCNFSVPGAGKTSVVYAAYAFLNSLPQDSPKHVNALIVVGPLSSFKAWEDEFYQIFQRHARSRRLSGNLPASERSDVLRGIDFASRDLELVLTSYQTLANGESEFREYLRNSRHRVMMILDEAHNVKREDGYWSNAALRLAPFASARVVLTGTPAPNGYEDLSNLFRFIYPERHLLGFPLPTLKAMSEGQLSRAVPTLKANIRPFYTRIRKSDLGLPEAIEHRVQVKMSPVHEKIYRSLERRIVPQLRTSFGSQAGQSAIRLRARLIRLRQAAINPDLLLRPIEDDELFSVGQDLDFNVAELEVVDAIRNFESSHDLLRLTVCKCLVKDVLEQQGKVLIWSYFLGNVELLRRQLGPLASFTEVLTGATPVSGDRDEDDSLLVTRERIIDQFHTTRDSAILIANPQAVGESISLHKACRTAIYFDRDFNCGRFIQSKDRIHRYSPSIGGAVTYHFLISPDTVDEQIDSRLALKERRMQELVDSDEIPLFTENFGENSDDILSILDAYESRKTF